MSHLEDKLTRGEFVVTAELPVIDGGGHAELQRQLEPMRSVVDAFNATDNPAAHAHVSPLAVAIGLRSWARSRSCSSSAATATAWRWRPTSWARRCTASRTSPA